MSGDRVEDLRKQFGIGLCNITKCCTKVCPEGITITDNAIIPLKETSGGSILRSALKVVPYFQQCESIGGVMHFELKSISCREYLRRARKGGALPAPE